MKTSRTKIFRNTAQSLGNCENFGCGAEFCGALVETTTPGTQTGKISANANILSHIIYKIHQSHNLSLDFEEERAILKSMEAAAGIAA